MREMENLVDAILNLNQGEMTFGRIKHPQNAGFWTVFFIREENKYIRIIPPRSVLEMRAGAIQIQNVCLVPILIQLGKQIYETWLDYYVSDGKGARRLFPGPGYPRSNWLLCLWR